MESKIRCLQPKHDREPGETHEESDPDNDGSGAGSVASHWKWYHTLEAVIVNTPNVNEDQVMKWPMLRFMTRLNYLTDVWDAEKHDAEIQKLRNASR